MIKVLSRFYKDICFLSKSRTCDIVKSHSRRIFSVQLHISPNSLLSLHNLHNETVNMGVFKFSDYDCIGFDLDNTLVSYDISNLVKLEYELLANFMVKQRGWDKKYLNEPLLDADIDFLQKGLVLDLDAGNILKISSDGTIIRASHGTKLLSSKEIEQIYPERKWPPTETLANNPLEVWNGPLSLRMRSLLDYFDMPVSLIFARAVDTCDDKETKVQDGCYKIWPDILDGLVDMFDSQNFKNNRGYYFPELQKNPEKYLRKCSPEVIAWLKEVKRKKTTFLITGSYIDYADFIATHALGKDWKSFFDIVVCFAKKPGFFVGERPFVALSGCKERETVEGDLLTRGGIYSQGNWQDLVRFFAKMMNKNSPKCLYVGDNLVQDIYVPGTLTDCDTVVLSEELRSKGTSDEEPMNPDEKFLKSRFWGSYFYHENTETKERTLWCDIIEKYSKICIPSMEVLARNNIDEPYKCFDKNDVRLCGFYPSKPGKPTSV